MAKVKKGSRKWWRGKCDTLWSKVIRLRDKRCLVCGSTENLQAHHLIGRNNYQYRYDLDNGATVCLSHHGLRFGDQKIAAHGPSNAAMAFLEWIRDRFPRRWAWFEENRNRSGSGDQLDYEAIHAELTEKYEELKGGA